MPGISEKDVKIDINGKEVTVTAEHETVKYKRKVNMNFKPKSDYKIRENHGIITVELKKK